MADLARICASSVHALRPIKYTYINAHTHARIYIYIYIYILYKYYYFANVTTITLCPFNFVLFCEQKFAPATTKKNAIPTVGYSNIMETRSSSATLTMTVR